MTRVARPISITIAVSRFFWFCRHCPVDAFDWTPTLEGALHESLAHVKVCPVVLRALDQLVASVMALPRYRSWCVECKTVIDDQVKHTDDHLVAAEVVPDRAALQAAAWTDLAARASSACPAVRDAQPMSEAV